MNALLLLPDATRGLVFLEFVEIIVILFCLGRRYWWFVGVIEVIVIVCVGYVVQESLALLVTVGY